MESHSLLLLSGYCFCVFVASFLGGKLSILGKLSHTRTQVVMSLVAGFILGIALFHLLPHGMSRIPGPVRAEHGVLWMALGIILMVVLLRMFQFHQHDFSGEATNLYDRQGQESGSPNVRSLLGIGVGMGIHTVTEGIALGASVQVAVQQPQNAAFAGLGVFLAIVLHKPLDAYSIVSMMRSVGYGQRFRTIANLGFALLCPAVALATFVVSDIPGLFEGPAAGYALAFAAGTFLCVALSDLLPEIQFHSHDRGKLILCFLVGIALAVGLHFLEAGVVNGEPLHQGH